jgi:hypothetical protein
MDNENTAWEWTYERSAFEQRPALTRTWGGWQQTITALYPHLFACQGVCVPDATEFYDRDFEAMMRFLDACIVPLRRSPFALEECRAAKEEAYQEKWDLAVQPVHDGFGGVWSRP